jgi:hypothetical protein
LLAKKGYKPITDEQAKELLELTKQKKNNIKFVKNGIEMFAATNESSKFIQVDVDGAVVDDEEDDTETRDIIGNAVKTKLNTEPKKLDDVREISMSQEKIQAEEQRAITGFQHKSTLERHMLEKYQLEIPPGRLSVMKAQANKMICDLAKQNRLYLVDGQIEAK